MSPRLPRILTSVSFSSTDIWRSDFNYTSRLTVSEFSKNLVLTNTLSEFDEAIQCKSHSLFFIRHFNFFNFLWFLKRLRFFFRYSRHLNFLEFLMYSDFYPHFPLLLYVARKNNFQHSLGWISGLWGNRALLSFYVSKTGLQTRFNFFLPPSAIFLLSSQAAITSRMLLEVSPSIPVVIHFQTLFDRVGLKFVGFFSFLVDITRIGCLYYHIELILNLMSPTIRFFVGKPNINYKKIFKKRKSYSSTLVRRGRNKKARFVRRLIHFRGAAVFRRNIRFKQQHSFFSRYISKKRRWSIGFRKNPAVLKG